MATAQPGIFAEERSYQYHLEYHLKENAQSADVKRGVRSLFERYAGRRAEEKPGMVIGFGAALWQAVAPSQQPQHLRPFAAIGVPGSRYAPATQRDLWVWFNGDRIDMNLEMALIVQECFAPVLSLAFEVQGFQYRDHRDLIGFVDGTANPKTDELRRAAALIPSGATGAGGAYAFTQNWVHQLAKFKHLPTQEQERVVGRTKEDDIELTGDQQPPDSHVSRTDVTHDGEAMKIWRRSTPYGHVAQHGLHFVAFACDPFRIDIQLQRMFGVSGDGLYDRLTDYSTPRTGSYWLVPSLEDLNSVMDIPKIHTAGSA